MDCIYRFIRKAFLSYKSLFSVLDFKTYLLMQVINPILQLCFFVLINKNIYQNSNLNHWIIGNALVLTYFNSLFGLGMQMTQERRIGTLKLLIACPSHSIGIFIPRAVVHIFDSLISVTSGLVAAFFFFNFRLNSSIIFQFYLIIFLGAFSAIGLGLFVSSIGLLTKEINLLLNLVSMFLLTFTGANIHIKSLPRFFQFIPKLLPLTRSIELARFIEQNGKIFSKWSLIMEELALGLLYAIGGFIFFKYFEKKSLKTGTLEAI